MKVQAGAIVLLMGIGAIAAPVQAQEPEPELIELCSRFPQNSRCAGLDIPIPLASRPGTEVSCALEFGAIERFNPCKINVTATGLTVYIEPRENRSSRRQGGETIEALVATEEVQIPFDQMLLTNIRTWNELTYRPEMLTQANEDEITEDEVVNSMRFAQIDITFDSEIDRVPRSNIFRIVSTDEYGIAFYKTLQTQITPVTAETIRSIAQRDQTSTGNQAASIQQLLETKTCIRCDLRGAQLAAADLEDANLEGANLENANLAGANLRNAYLFGANLNGANLTEISADHAKFMLASLAGANFRDADLNGVNFQGANLRSANLENADLSIDSWLNFSVLSNADLTEANLKNANLEGIQIEEANLTNANLQDARIGFETLANSTDSQYLLTLIGQSQRVAAVLGVPFTERQFQAQTSFIGSNLSNANLSNTDLAEALLMNANFSGAILTGAKTDADELVNLNLCGATLPDGLRSNQGCP